MTVDDNKIIIHVRRNFVNFLMVLKIKLVIIVVVSDLEIDEKIGW
jgi:hypothetical protein